MTFDRIFVAAVALGATAGSIVYFLVKEAEHLLRQFAE